MSRLLIMFWNNERQHTGNQFFFLGGGDLSKKFYNDRSLYSLLIKMTNGFDLYYQVQYYRKLPVSNAKCTP